MKESVIDRIHLRSFIRLVNLSSSSSSSSPPPLRCVCESEWVNIGHPIDGDGDGDGDDDRRASPLHVDHDRDWVDMGEIDDHYWHLGLRMTIYPWVCIRFTTRPTTR